MKTEKQFAVALSICSSPAMNRIWNSISLYNPQDLYEKLLKDKELTTQGFIQSKYPADPLEAAEKICGVCVSKKINIISYWDENYPKFLKEITIPPIVLYCKGALKYEKSIAIVGTRKADKRSSDVARRLSSELAASGFSIVSGMAIGIDREAHLGALKSNSSTIGVLANGIDIVYPAYNRDVYSAICSSDKSALISEYPPGILAGKWTFVRRNRIISGLALGTIIVKAAEKSGALITAHYALEQGREVFVCPGPAFDNTYSGCHDLLKSGAILVSGTDDILKELSDYRDRITLIEEKTSVINKSAKEFDSLEIMQGRLNFEEKYPRNSIEGKILEIISRGETDLDSIVRLLDYNPNQINEAVMMLELSNDIAREGNLISKS
jgi:DNA processing protein